MSFPRIHSALINAYQGAGLALTTAMEGREFTPPNNGAFARITILPTDADPVELGSTGRDEHTGILQIDIWSPVDEGRAVTLARIETLRTYLKAGATFDYSGQIVRIRKNHPRAITFHQGRCLASIDIYWRARVSRT